MMKRTVTLLAVIFLGMASLAASDATDDKSPNRDLSNIEELLEELTEGTLIGDTNIEFDAQKTPRIIPENEVTIEKLHSFFQAAFLPSRLSKDNRLLLIEQNGVKILLLVNIERKIISYVSVWHLKKSFPEDAKLRLVNKLNNKLPLVRFSMPKPEELWCDYQISYENGVYAYQIISSYRIFLRTVQDAAMGCYQENIIGSEEAVDPKPAEPREGLGLILGRVTLKFDGYKGKHKPYSRPLTVHIMHKAGEEEDSDAKVIQAVADDQGYFTVGNLSPERRYWVKRVEGHDFVVNIPFTVSTSIRAKNSDSNPQADVLDVGCFALSVNAEGSIGCQLTSSDCTMTKKAGKSGSSVQFNASPPLERHSWFLATYPSSDWAAKVRDHQRQIEREREEKARKKRGKETKKKTESEKETPTKKKPLLKAPTPPVPVPKKAAPSPQKSKTPAPSDIKTSSIHVPFVASASGLMCRGNS